MPIVKRLSPEERLKKQLPKGWKATLAHPLMKKITYGPSGFNPTPKNVVQAINITKSWKGATYQQKLFVLCLDLLMEKAYGRSVLDPDNYNRLQDHMESNQDKMQSKEMSVWMIWCWDYYHDFYKLHDLENGTLVLRRTVNRKKIKPKAKHSRKKLKKHKQ